MTKYTVRLLICFMVICVATFAQSGVTGSVSMPSASIQHSSLSATVTATDLTRPMLEAVLTIGAEYGWAVNFEEPSYAGKPAGGTFKSTYPESAEIYASSSSEAAVLNKLVADYNAGNFGATFSAVAQSDGSVSVIGSPAQSSGSSVSQAASILDTPITIPSDTRNAVLTLELIATTLSAAIGKHVYPTYNINWIGTSKNVTIGGNSVPARTLLLQALQGMPMKVRYYLAYDYDKTFFLGILPVVRAQYGTFGKRTLVPTQ